MHGKQTNAGSREGEVSAYTATADNVEPLKSSDHNALQIIESMEQGILVWSPDGRCSMFNERIFDVLELDADNLWIGMERSEFLRMAVSRGEFSERVVEQTERNFNRAVPFSFDRALPSGRVVVTTSPVSYTHLTLPTILLV